MKKLLSIALSLIMVLTMLPTFAITASAYTAGSIAGTTGDGTLGNPVVCDTYAEIKAAMENDDIVYVQLNSVSRANGRIETTKVVGTIWAGINVDSTKELIVNGDSVFTALLNSDKMPVDRLFHIDPTGNVTVQGSGSITFRSSLSNGSNAIFYNQGTLTINDNITFDASYNATSNTKAIWQESGNLIINGGTFSAVSAIGKDTRQVVALYANKGNVRINKGTFIATAEGGSLSECYGAEIRTATVTIKEGTFTNGILCSGSLSDYVDENSWAYIDSNDDLTVRRGIGEIFVNGNITTGDALNDNGPLKIAPSLEIDSACFSYYKNGKPLATNTKATYGNYDCTIALFATDGYKFTNSTVLNFNGKSYKPTNVMNNGEIAIFEIPNIYVECNHTAIIWQTNADEHWKICPTCKAKYDIGAHDFTEKVSGKTITFTCKGCGYQKTGKVAETRTAIYRPYIDFGTAMVGDAIPTTVKLDYANLRSGSEKYYNYATVQSVKYSTTGTFKNAKTTVTVVLKANKDYYFESIALPTPVSSCYLQYTRESVNVSEDGTTLTAVFSFTPYTPSDVTLTLPEFTAGKTYAEIAKEVQFKVNGVVAKDYSVSIKKAGESSWTLGSISDGVCSQQYMYEKVIEPNTEYEFGVNSNINGTYAKSLTITNKNVAVITDSYYGEAVARVNANYTSTEGHNYDAGTITKQATYTENGLITFRCTDPGCSATKTVVIPKKRIHSKRIIKSLGFKFNQHSSRTTPRI